MTLSVLCVGVSVCALAMTTATHAATPITLPFGDFGLKSVEEMHLPVPPPPQVERPDPTQMRLVIKRQPLPVRGGCEAESARPAAGDRRQAGAGRAAGDGRLHLRQGFGGQAPLPARA